MSPAEVGRVFPAAPWTDPGGGGPPPGRRAPRIGDEIEARGESFVVVQVEMGTVVAEADVSGREETFQLEQLEAVGEGHYREKEDAC